MDTRVFLNKVAEVVCPVIDSLAYRLVDLEYTNEHGRWILRVFVERSDGGINMGDCEKISHAIEGVLDVEDLIPHRYSLEVSSPGLDRPLRTREDFVKFAGQAVRIKTKAPINGRGNYYGSLNGVENSDVLVTVDGVEYKIPVDAIAKARLEYRR